MLVFGVHYAQSPASSLKSSNFEDFNQQKTTFIQNSNLGGTINDQDGVQQMSLIYTDSRQSASTNVAFVGPNLLSNRGGGCSLTVAAQMGISSGPSGYFVEAGNQLGRLFRDGVAAICPNKPYPGIFNAATQYNWTSVRFYNSSAGNVCITVNVDVDSGTLPCTVNGHGMVYQSPGGVSTSSYDPANQGTNFIGDVGSSISQPFSVEVGPGWFEVVFSNTTTLNNCDFGFTIDDGGTGSILCDEAGGGSCTQDDITTLFAQNNQFAGNMFDVTAGAEDILIEGFDINITAGPATISVYSRPGTYVGFEGNSAGWTLMGTDVVNGVGTDSPTNVNIGGLTIPAGQTYGMYVTVSDYPSVSMNYTNGNNVFSDGNITLTLGVGKGNPDFAGGTFLSRSWNGTIYYCYGTGGGGGGGGACQQATSSAGFQNGFFNESPNIVACDVLVGADDDFTLEQITMNQFHNPGTTIASVNLFYYANAGGQPGALIGSETVVPTSQSVIGSNFGFDVSQVVLDVTPFLFAGQAAIPTTYWIGATVLSANGGQNAWESNLTPQGNPMWQFFLGNWVNTFEEGVYTFSGQCSASGGGGGTCVSTTYNATGLPADIDPGGTQTVDCVNAPNLYPVDVTGNGVIGVDAELEDVTINITHTWSGDLEIYLRSPSGTELMLWDNVGGSGDNFTNTQFQDGGISSAGSTAPHTNIYVPVGGTFAATFAGEDINGNWQLKICDTAGGDTGTLDSFSITFCVEDGGSTNNWECADAIALECGDVVVGTTTGATNSGGNGSPDVFYTYTGSGTPEIVTISLCDGGTTYDSFLRVFASCANLNLGSEIVLNDDFCGLQSQLNFESDGTSTYIIMVEGFGTASGNYSLAITCEPNIPPACGGVFTDSGGASGNYSNNEDITWTITPDPDDFVTVIFTAFDVEATWDALYVFDGPNTSAPLISSGNPPTGTGFPAGGWYGTTIPGPFSSTHPSGALTFRFLSDGSVTRPGWIADIVCSPVPPPNDLIVNAIDVDQFAQPYTDPAVRLMYATNELLNPSGCSIAGTNGVWYKFTAASDGSASASITTPAGASAVLFFEAPDEDVTAETELTFNPVATNQCGPGTSASINAVAGQSYYIFVLNTGGPSDVVIDISDTLSAPENSIVGFNFYPNPVRNVLNISADTTLDRVELYTVLGQTVLKQNIGANNAQLNVSELATGVYLMRVTSQGATSTYQIIKK